MQLSLFASRKRAPQTDDAPPRAPCPTCGETEGFLLVVDGAVYRVLEDQGDTELLAEQGDLAETFVTCCACKTTMDAQTVLDAFEADLEMETAESPPEPRIRMGPRRNRIHPTGRAHLRRTTDGRDLPQCPECAATHDFFVDLDGAAYRVLEDDDDTDLLGEATNLLCSRCHAVFEL